ncbi:extensin [Sphingomonas sp. MAH-20]|uniref:Extensin n=1 Tax=Sphingomonas horti TaxID=2682842 RepID=A0A6I4IX50_9SPHN|nr:MULTISPECIES: extensin family protein [Sphingomonas]MBA2920433.1 extensin family protein [Sphingomonas sp. CGMCC 1.13658]MVO76687.1 extensin [Sphingomonas horti]
MRIAGRLWRATIFALVLIALICWYLVWTRAHPQDSPFTALDLTQPIGMFTGRKIAGLREDTRECETLLFRAGIRYRTLPPAGTGQCAYDDAVRLTRGGALSAGFRPERLDVSCAVAAGLAVWERQVVQPAAERFLGTRVTTVEHYGSYSCRRMYGRATGDWSEHARANALDVAGFRLSDGRRVTVVADWNEGTLKEQQFLREVRDGACKVFATVLGPGYNAAHRDHLHLDQAARGELGWRACR